MEYVELTVELIPRNPWAEILVAELAENGFDGFVDTENGIKAYAERSSIDESDPLKSTCCKDNSSLVSCSYRLEYIPHQNWNAVWEADFHPVYVEDYVTIRAPFHDSIDVKGMDVIIEPKMSFGTGHHETTWMMAKLLFEQAKIPEKVLDMGTGTGILAIIADKLGAQEVLAVDIEDWSVENTLENAERNHCKSINALCGDIDSVSESEFDLILANINKNVLKAHIPFYATLLKDGGRLCMSGYFTSDAEEVRLSAEKYRFELSRTISKENWMAIEFIKKS
jgi:ribosomal protein L11 methyltransferase